MLALTAALLCVFANAFFVAAEFALARVRPTSLEARARAGDAKAEKARHIAARLDAYLTAAQFGITLASLGLGWLGEPALAHVLEPPLVAAGLSAGVVHGVALVVAFVIITLLHIVVGELVPKSLAILHPESLARHTATPMQWFYVATYPFLFVLNGMSNAMLRSFGLRMDGAGDAKLSADELRLLVQSSFSDDQAQSHTKRELLERVLKATDRPVRATMVPRVDIVTLPLAASYEEGLEQVRRTGFSRYPVADNGDPDQIAGYVYVKDLLLAGANARRTLDGLKRDILFVPESRQVGELLGEFRNSGIPLAIVVDEYGGTSGLVTVEDVVEELVGDLHDELEAGQPRVELREDGSYVVDGILPVDDLDLEGFDVAEEHRGDTVSAYVIGILGRLAHPGDRVPAGSFELTVEDVRRRRIGRVAIRPRVPTEPPPEAAALAPAASEPPHDPDPSKG